MIFRKLIIQGIGMRFTLLCDRLVEVSSENRYGESEMTTVSE